MIKRAFTRCSPPFLSSLLRLQGKSVRMPTSSPPYDNMTEESAFDNPIYESGVSIDVMSMQDVDSQNTSVLSWSFPPSGRQPPVVVSCFTSRGRPPPHLSPPYSSSVITGGIKNLKKEQVALTLLRRQISFTSWTSILHPLGWVTGTLHVSDVTNMVVQYVISLSYLMHVSLIITLHSHRWVNVHLQSKLLCTNKIVFLCIYSKKVSFFQRCYSFKMNSRANYRNGCLDLKILSRNFILLLYLPVFMLLTNW